jgi:hypothetical protein
MKFLVHRLKWFCSDTISSYFIQTLIKNYPKTVTKDGFIE